MSLLTLTGAGPSSPLNLVAALRTNLRTYWKLEEASGTRADSTATGATLTSNGTPGNNTGQVGNAVDLNGTSQYLSRAHGSDVTLADTDFTVMGWIRPTAVGDRTVFDKYASGGGGNGFLLAIAAFYSNKLSFDAYRSGVNTGTVQSPSALSINTWYHFCAMHDSVNNIMYLIIDDGTVQQVATTNVGTDSGGAFGIGARASSPSLYFSGRIDEVGIWDYIVPAALRTAHKNLTTPY